MFVLRRVTKDRVVCNMEIGNSYDYYEKDSSEFNRIVEEQYPEKPQGLYALIIGGNGNLFGIFENHENYIMSENGKTFANISKRSL